MKIDIGSTVVLKNLENRKYNKMIPLEEGMKAVVLESPNDFFPTDAFYIEILGGKGIGAIDKNCVELYQPKKQVHLVDRYTYTVAWSYEDQAFIARVLEFRSLVTHGNTQSEAMLELRSLLKDVIDDLIENNEPVPDPLEDRKYSGKFIVRTTESLHKHLVKEAAREGISLNQLVNLKLAQ